MNLKRFVILCVATAIGYPSPAFTFTQPWHRDLFSVCVSAPPAALLVIRSDGKRAGVNPVSPLSAVGIGTVLNEFPLANVDQQNTFTDESDGTRTPGPQTLWTVQIMDESPSNYVVQLKGLSFRVATLDCSLSILPRSIPESLPSVILRVIMTPGVTKKFRLSSDRNSQAVSASRVIGPLDLDQSVAAACKLGLISSDGTCRSLAAKAREAGAAAERGNIDALRGLVRSFEAELQAQAGKHVKEPALAILREEAEALLNPPPPMPKPKPKPKATTKPKK